MTAIYDTEYISLGTSIAIYKKSNSKNWYVWFSVEKLDGTSTDIRKSLRVKSEAEARIKAVELRAEYRADAKRGYDVDNPYRLFRDVANGCFKEIWEGQLTKKTTRTKPYTFGSRTRNFSDNNKRTLSFIENEIVPKIGDKPFLAVTTDDLRLSITKDGDPDEVAKSTIAFRLSVLTKIYDFAGQRNVIKKGDRPDFPIIETRMKKRRKHFTDHQVEGINKIIDTWIGESKSGDKQQLDNRKMFKYYFNFNIYVGARIGIEISENTFGDLTQDTVNGIEYFQLHIYQGKTQNYSEDRQAVISRPAESYLQEITQWKFGLTVKETIEQFPQRKLFSRPCDNKVPDFVYLWTRIRERAIQQGLIAEQDKSLFSLYSTRHKYATDLLKKHMRDKDFSINALSKQLGTSEKMLNEVYQHTSATNIADTFYTAFDSENDRTLYENKELSVELATEYVNYFKLGEVPKDLDGFDRIRETAKIIEAKYNINSGDITDLHNLMILIINSNNATDIELDIVADLIVNASNVVSYKSDIRKSLYLFCKYHIFYFKEIFTGELHQLKRLKDCFDDERYFDMSDAYTDILSISKLLKNHYNDVELFDLLLSETMIEQELKLYKKEFENETTLVDFEFCRKEITQIENNYNLKINDKQSAIEALMTVNERNLLVVFIEYIEKLDALKNELTTLETHALLFCKENEIGLGDCENYINEYLQNNLFIDQEDLPLYMLRKYVDLKNHISTLTSSLGIVEIKKDNVVKLSFVK